MTKEHNKTQASYTKRLRDKGLIPLQIWINPENKQAIKDFATKLEGEKL